MMNNHDEKSVTGLSLDKKLLFLTLSILAQIYLKFFRQLSTVHLETLSTSMYTCDPQKRTHGSQEWVMQLWGTRNGFVRPTHIYRGV